MSDEHAEHKDFNAEKIFLWLFLFTAGEIGYGMLGRGLPTFWLWGGLSAFAVAKFWLILQYFMHFRYEGPIVKWLMYPTPFLIAVILLNVSPDVSRNKRMDHPIGARFDPLYGEIVHEMGEYDEITYDKDALHGHGGGHGDHADDAGAEPASNDAGH